MKEFSRTQDVSTKALRGQDALRRFKTHLAYYSSEALEYPFAMPRWVYISLTHSCTYRCQMCGVVSVLKGKTLSLVLARKAVDEIAGWKDDCVVTLTGGEPFLRADIFEIIAYAASKGITIEAVTNGALIDEAKAKDIISSGLTNIAVSLDGAQAVTHDSIRQKGSFAKALTALRNLAAAKKENGQGPQISVWTTIMKENVTELYDIIGVAKDSGAECLVYHPVIVAQDDMQNTVAGAPFWIQKDGIGTLKSQIDAIDAYQKANGMVAFLHDPYLWVKYFDGTLRKKEWKCNPFVFINIGPDAEVRSCGAAFGNLRTMSIKECLLSNEAYRARRKMKECDKPCLQTCWASPESDSLPALTAHFIQSVQQSQRKEELLADALGALVRFEEKLNERG